MRSVFLSIVTTMLFACAVTFATGHQAGPMGQEAADLAGAQWRSYAGDVRGTNYSPLSQIDSDNFRNLEMAWQWVPEDEYPPFSRFQVPPVMVDGALYFSTPLWQGVAIDAATGETVWVYSPTHRRDELSAAPQPWSPTGVAYWSDGERRGRVFWGTGNGYLICADAYAGLPCAGFGVEGTGRVNVVADLTADSVSAGSPPLAGAPAPIVVNDSVIYGQLQGSLGAWDVRTGRPRWSFNTVPQGDVGAETWADVPASGASASNSALMLAADNDHVYFPGWTSADGRRWPALTALDINTGERVWHHEVTGGGSPGYGFSMHPNVVNVANLDGLVAQMSTVSTDGLVFVFRRATGEQLWQSPAVSRYGAEARRDRADAAAVGGQRVPWVSAVDPETETLYVSTSQGISLSAPEHAMSAFDLRTGERLWEIVAGEDTNALPVFDAEAPAAGGCPGGPLLTKTLIIHCRGSVSTDGRPRLVAYSKDGTMAGSLDLPRRAIASPLTYMVGEVQYLAVAIEGNQLVGYAPESGATPVGVALTGWDRDQDGLRDDVQGALARMYEDAEIRAVMEGGTRAYQMAVLASATTEDDDDVAAAEAISRFVWCLNEYPGVDTWRELAAAQFLVLDTDARDSAYRKFESGREGALPRVVPASRAECMR